MKTVIAAATAVAFLASALPASAQNWQDRNHPYYHRLPPPPQRVVDAHRFREGQIWRGHHLYYRGGRWGYYHPSNGAQVFIHVNI